MSYTGQRTRLIRELLPDHTLYLTNKQYIYFAMSMDIRVEHMQERVEEWNALK
jgi:hypothetical protein